MPLRSLEMCESPARILNVTGPETISVLRAANYFADRFGRSLKVAGEPGRLALLNNAGACHASPRLPSDVLTQFDGCRCHLGRVRGRQPEQGDEISSHGREVLMSDATGQFFVNCCNRVLLFPLIHLP